MTIRKFSFSHSAELVKRAVSSFSASPQQSDMQSEKKSKQTARIVVIGAGPAGIAAATCLLAADFKNVLILEAENRVGGRIYTVPFADNIVDLGAQWCHGAKNNVVYELAQKCDAVEPTASFYDDYKCVRSNQEVLSEAVAVALKTIAFNTITERQADLINYEGTLGSYLTDKFWHELRTQRLDIDRVVAQEFFDNFKKFESSVEAADHLFEVSGKGHLEYWLCEGELLLNWKKEGFAKILHILMQTKTNASSDLGILNSRVLFNQIVNQIDWRNENDSGVIIKCWNGEIIEADHVICTASLGVLQENYKTMFTPALPAAKCRAIEGLKLGTVDKFFIEFAQPFGPKEWTGIGFLWRDEDLNELRKSKNFWLESVFGFYRVSHQPRLLQGWIIGAHARHMETLPETEVQEALLWLFRKFLVFKVPNPIKFMRTQWYSNRNFRGSYSFRSVYTDELRTSAADLAAPLTDQNGKLVLQFAGEATHSHYYSTVHGAVESGWREAQRLIGCYKDKKAQL